MPLYCVDVQTSSDGNELLILGWDRRQRVIVRIPKFQLEEHFQEAPMAPARLERIVMLNFEAIERAARRKFRSGEFHSDTVAGEDARCVHVGPADILRGGDCLVDPDATEVLRTEAAHQ